MTQAGMILGTPGYMAPEQVNGEPADGRADLFGLGCVLYRAATGRAPFEGKTLTALLRAVAEHDPTPPHAVNPAVPEPLSELILRLLAKAPDGRPASAAEVARALHALEPCVHAPDLDPLPDRKTSEPAPAQRRRRVWPLAGALLLAVAGGVVLLGLSSLRDAGQSEPLEGHGRVADNPTEPVKVLRLDVLHYARKGESEGLVGRLGVADGSFRTRLDDSVTVAGRLSEPAYCYLIAYRPDGTEDLCFPEDAAAPPPLTDEPQFPLKAGGDHYGLEEGEGLMAFVLVASRQPLPAYAAWKQSRGDSPWRPTRTAPDVVWRGDDRVLRPATPNAPDARGKRPAETGLGPLTELLAWLRRDGRFGAVEAVAFPVLPKP